MNVAVTGGNGFIGRHVVAVLAAAGHTVTVLSRGATPIPGAARIVRADIIARDLAAQLAAVEAIVHLAAIADASLSAADPVGYTEVNSGGTLNILEAARQIGAGVVFASSQRVYAPWQGPQDEAQMPIPSTVYGWGKLAAEGWATMYRQTYDLPAITLRLFSVYGPGQRTGGGVSGVVAIFAERALRGQALAVHQRHVRDFVYVEDVAAAILRATERLRDPALTGRVYNIGSGVPTSLDALAALVRHRAGMAEQVAITVAADATERREDVYATIARAEAELGWTPTVALSDGIDRYLAWLRGELAREGAR